MDGLAGSAGAVAGGAGVLAIPAGAGASVRTSATKRKPLRGTVRTTACRCPLSPTAVRTALIWLARVDSETMRPFQTAWISSSRSTTRSRFASK
ncbi:Uncharacterised protein [Bordetella pertussis]|nr:Uncharacterised protein [Bordetella pertussis]CPN92398.1 Uncharacterised protein [Bordetella pertussis]CPO89593.1 Uncharacterised protein [Bordetella pertussis]CRE22355.1 Uncharacterised protein [Bordetella pertussis]CRE23673.1 Uncharacterised protein [Bordetella pertussis]